MNEADAKRLGEVERFFDKYKNEYGLAPEDVAWLIERVKVVESALQEFESVMDQEMEWHNKLIDSGKRKQFSSGAYSAWRDVKRCWKHTRQVLRGGNPDWKS